MKYINEIIQNFYEVVPKCFRISKAFTFLASPFFYFHYIYKKYDHENIVAQFPRNHS